MTEDEIYDKAQGKWGYLSQALMAVEEAAELQQALLHHLRGRNTHHDVMDEIADMTIMCRQMRRVFDPKEVDERIKYKLDRLQDRLEVVEIVAGEDGTIR